MDGIGTTGILAEISFFLSSASGQHTTVESELRAQQSSFTSRCAVFQSGNIKLRM